MVGTNLNCESLCLSCHTVQYCTAQRKDMDFSNCYVLRKKNRICELLDVCGGVAYVLYCWFQVLLDILALVGFSSVLQPFWSAREFAVS